jgi:recombination protein RecR
MVILRWSAEEARRLAESIVDVKEKIRFCSVCFNLAEGELCAICSDPTRDRERICVVEDPDSLTAIEESGCFRGTYHVLHGALAPLDGIGPDQIRIHELAERLERGGVREVVLATNPSVQGEATALLILRLIKNRDIEVTRIGLGMPVGGDLRYSDKMTLAKAMEYRRGM